MIVIFIFGISLAACMYLYFGYPALLFALSRRRPRPVRRAAVTPLVSVIVPAHNEEALIGEKVRNALSLRYPADRLEVIVASDGSTDGTDAAVAAIPDSRVRLLRLERGGKSAALNQGSRAARGEVLVFTDANTWLEGGSLAALMEAFADPEVGGVCGGKRQRSPARADATARGEGLYWRYDQWQKELESAVGSVFAADGALYAVRRELFVPIAGAQADDIAISARVVLQGRRLVFEPRALAWEDAPTEARAEFSRKVRVTNHSVLALLHLGRGLWASGFYSLELISHKLLRHLAPIFLIALLASSAALVPRGRLFAAAFAAQVVFYGLAAAGFLLRRTPAGRWRALGVPYYFSLVNAAALIGVLSVVRGERLVAWSPRQGLEKETS